MNGTKADGKERENNGSSNGQRRREIDLNEIEKWESERRRWKRTSFSSILFWFFFASEMFHWLIHETVFRSRTIISNNSNTNSWKSWLTLAAHRNIVAVIVAQQSTMRKRNRTDMIRSIPSILLCFLAIDWRFSFYFSVRARWLWEAANGCGWSDKLVHSRFMPDWMETPVIWYFNIFLSPRKFRIYLRLAGVVTADAQ